MDEYTINEELYNPPSPNEEDVGDSMHKEDEISSLQFCSSLPKNKYTHRLILGKDLDEVFRQNTNQRWLIDQIIPKSAGLTVLYGQPGTYKSFIALDMGLSIASGLDWHGSKVEKRKVLYIAAEGQHGVLKRIAAWKIHHEIEDLTDFALLPFSCTLDNESELSALMEMMKNEFLPEVVFIDTLARSMSGDENSTHDMGNIIMAVETIISEFGLQVVFIHHTGKDDNRGPRGSLALTGASDTMFCMKISGKNPQVSMVCERQKDDVPHADMVLDMELVDVGALGGDEKPITSLVPILRDSISSSTEIPNLSISEEIALKALSESEKDITKEVTAIIEGSYSDIPRRVADEETWRDKAFQLQISAGNAEAKRKAFKRAIKTLMAKELIRGVHGYYWKQEEEK